MDYKLYLESEHWQSLRERYALNDCCHALRWACDLAYGKGMNVHHLNYDHLGCERPEDLEVLCYRCHELEHFKETALPKIIVTACHFCQRPKITFDPPTLLQPDYTGELEPAGAIIRDYLTRGPHRVVRANPKLLEVMHHPVCQVQEQLRDIQKRKLARWPHLVGKGIAPESK